jgi:uncharacterized protein YjbI with pentapeptide repeats
MATEDKSFLSPDQKELNRPLNDQMEQISKQLRRSGYKVIVEYDDTGQPSKVSGEIPSRKMWWDWLDLLAKLAIPLVVVLATIGWGWWQVHLADSQHQQDQQSANLQHERDQQSALDQQQATILQTYIDNIQDLLVNHQLFSTNDFEIREMAEARTVAALSKLDPKRKGIVVQFLMNAGLIGYQNLYTHKRYPAIIFLYRADLTNADLTGTYLEYADLATANLTNVNLTKADLKDADLSGVTLGCYRVNGKDYCSDLKDADLSSALLGCSKVGGEVISQGKIVCANLSGAKNLTQQQLDQVYTCQGATLPQGLTCNRTGAG